MRFRFSDSFLVDVSEEPWRSQGLRVGVFANPGAGKSYTTALMVEQWMDQGGTVVIFEPNAEWHTLKQKYPVQVVGGPFNQDVPLVDGEPALYAGVVVEQGVSMVFYTRDVPDQEKLIDFICRFIDKVIGLQEIHHRPLLLVLEEAHQYAPMSAKGQIAPPWVYNRMIKVFVDCYTQGRKLNICPVSLTQRPQLLNFTIRQLCNLVWFGGFSSQDSTYLDKEVLAPLRRKGVDVSAGDLLGVPRGEWLVVTDTVTHRVKVTEARRTPHGADTPTLDYVQPVGESIQRAVSELGEQLKAMLEKRAAEESELEKARRKIRELTDKVEDLQGKVKLGVDLKALLQAQNGLDESGVKRRLVEAEERHRREVEELQGTIAGLRDQIGEFEALRRENQRLSEQAAKLGALEDVLRDIVEPLIPMPQPPSVSEAQIEDVVDRKLQRLSPAQRSRAVSRETGIPWVDMWLPKLGTAEKKVVLLLANKFPLPLTKSQIALSIGLTAKGGYFTGALNNLLKWKLVEQRGEDHKLAEAPS